MFTLGLIFRRGRDITWVVPWLLLLLLASVMFYYTRSGGPRPSRDLVVNSTFRGGLAGWDFHHAGPMKLERIVGRGGVASENQVAYIGNGRSSGFKYFSSDPITVVPGRWYSLSGFVDASMVISGEPEWAVFDVTLQRGLATAPQAPGFSARALTTFIMPSGVWAVRIIGDTNNSTVSRGGKLVFRDPELREAAVGSP